MCGGERRGRGGSEHLRKVQEFRFERPGTHLVYWKTPISNDVSDPYKEQTQVTIRDYISRHWSHSTTHSPTLVPRTPCRVGGSFVSVSGTLSSYMYI